MSSGMLLLLLAYVQLAASASFPSALRGFLGRLGRGDQRSTTQVTVVDPAMADVYTELNWFFRVGCMSDVGYQAMSPDNYARKGPFLAQLAWTGRSNQNV